MKNHLGLPAHLFELTRARAPSDSDDDDDESACSSNEEQKSDCDSEDRSVEDKCESDEDDHVINTSEANAAMIEEVCQLAAQAVDIILATAQLEPQDLLNCVCVDHSWREAGMSSPLWLQWCRTHGVDRVRELLRYKLHYLAHAEKRCVAVRGSWNGALGRDLCDALRASVRETPAWPPAPEIQAYEEHLQREAREGGFQMVGETDERPDLQLPPGLTALFEVGLQVADAIDGRADRFGMHISVANLTRSETFFCAQGGLAEVAQGFFGSYLDGCFNSLCIEWRPGKPPRFVHMIRGWGGGRHEPLETPDGQMYPFPEDDSVEPDQVFGIFADVAELLAAAAEDRDGNGWTVSVS